LKPLLEVRGLTVDFTGPRSHRAVDGVDIGLAPRERLAIVGESGSGKSQLLLACVGLLAANGQAGGSARFDGKELLSGDAAAGVRGTGIGFVFQEAGASLTPHRRIGDQLTEVAMTRTGLSSREARAQALAMLDRVRLPEPRSQLARYPHELSGGMRQRVAIALALVAEPRILFADEPTTALDVTVQADVLALLSGICDDLGMALVLVTHDLGVVASIADRVAVMYAGRVIEEGRVADVLARPLHPYTSGLLSAVPSLADSSVGDLATIPGQPPPPGTRFPGCRFEPRCPHAGEPCRRSDPPLASLGELRVACHFPLHTAPAA
jgi:oligopeptide transport system ATP-binding protein